MTAWVLAAVVGRGAQGEPLYEYCTSDRECTAYWSEAEHFTSARAGYEWATRFGLDPDRWRVIAVRDRCGRLC